MLHGYTRERRRRPDRPLRRRPSGRRDARARSRLRLRSARTGRRRPRTLPATRGSRASSRPTFSAPAESTGGRVSFTDSGVEATDDGQPLLVQAENAGLTPESGCRMGICHSCTRRKTSGDGTQPDHRNGIHRRGRGRADLRVRSRRRRRDRPLGKENHDYTDHHAAEDSAEDRRRQDRHPDPRAGRGVRRASSTRSRSAWSPTSASATSPTSGGSSRPSAASRSQAARCSSAASSRRSGSRAPRCWESSKILDNMEIGHNIMHGQYDWTGDPALASKKFEWDTACPSDQWRHSHNYMHHTYTNIVGHGPRRRLRRPADEQGPEVGARTTSATRSTPSC